VRVPVRYPFRILVDTVQFRGILLLLPLAISATSRAGKYLKPTGELLLPDIRHFNTDNALCLLRLGDRSIVDRSSARARLLHRDLPGDHYDWSGMRRNYHTPIYSTSHPLSPPPPPLSLSLSLSLCCCCCSILPRSLRLSRAHSTADGPDNFRFVHR